MVVDLHKVIDRELDWKTQKELVTYNYKVVEIPRCKTCQKVHNYEDDLLLYALGLGIVLALIYTANRFLPIKFYDIFSFILGILVVFLISVFFASLWSSIVLWAIMWVVRLFTGTAPMESKKEFSTVKIMFEQGYRLGEAPPGVKSREVSKVP
jgi:hypothetical protein